MIGDDNFDRFQDSPIPIQRATKGKDDGGGDEAWQWNTRSS